MFSMTAVSSSSSTCDGDFSRKDDVQQLKLQALQTSAPAKFVFHRNMQLKREWFAGESWAADVRKMVAVHDTDGELGVIYLDLYPRSDNLAPAVQWLRPHLCRLYYAGVVHNTT